MKRFVLAAFVIAASILTLSAYWSTGDRKINMSNESTKLEQNIDVQQAEPTRLSQTQTDGKVIEFAVRGANALPAFQKLIREKGDVMIDFWAPRCAPCRAIAPYIKELAAQYQDISFVKVDIDTNPEIARKYGIRSIPQLHFFKKGNYQKDSTLIGGLPKKDIERRIKQVFNIKEA